MKEHGHKDSGCSFSEVAAGKIGQIAQGAFSGGSHERTRVPGPCLLSSCRDDTCEDPLHEDSNLP